MSTVEWVLTFFCCIGTYTLTSWLIMRHNAYLAERRHQEFLSRMQGIPPGTWMLGVNDPSNIGPQGEPGIPGPPGVPVDAETRAMIDRELTELRRLELGQ